MFVNYGITRFPKPFYHARRQEHLFPRRPPNLSYEKGYTKLELTAKYPHLTSGRKCFTRDLSLDVHLTSVTQRSTKSFRHKVMWYFALQRKVVWTNPMMMKMVSTKQKHPSHGLDSVSLKLKNNCRHLRR